MSNSTFGSDWRRDKTKLWVGPKPPVTSSPPASYLDREEWPHSTGGSPGGAGYKWPCCVPPSGSRHCSQSGWSLRAGCWSGPEGSHGGEPWAGCSRELHDKMRVRGHAQREDGGGPSCRLPYPPPCFSPSFPSSPPPGPLLVRKLIRKSRQSVLESQRKERKREGKEREERKGMMRRKEKRNSSMKYWVTFGSGGSRGCAAQFRLSNPASSQRDTETIWCGWCQKDVTAGLRPLESGLCLSSTSQLSTGLWRETNLSGSFSSTFLTWTLGLATPSA